MKYDYMNEYDGYLVQSYTCDKFLFYLHLYIYIYVCIYILIISDNFGWVGLYLIFKI